MTGQENNQYGWCRSGLRTRYRPRARICRGLLEAAPWLNLALLIIFFLLAGSRLVLKPGVAVELPTTTAVTGTRAGPTAVVLSREGPPGVERVEMVFFDDEPFAVRDRIQMGRLQRRLAQVAAAQTNQPLILEADISVKYGTISTLCAMGRDAGFKSVNLAQARMEGKPRE